MSHKILIIGAGIAGLSTGAYLQANGYDTEIYEAHTLPGGVCTAWQRGEYTIDYCVHWLMGTREGTGFDRMWSELGALTEVDGQPTPIANFDAFTIIELSTGERVTLFSEISRLEEEFLRIAPEDQGEIKRLCRDMRVLSSFRIPVATEAWRTLDKIRFGLENAPGMLKALRYMRMTMGKLEERFSNPSMKELFTTLIPSDWSANALVFGLAMQHTRSAGYPIGGSLPLAKRIERTYLERGGVIHYGRKVQKITTETGKTTGILLADGQTIAADTVVSAADGHSTLYRMLSGEHNDPKLVAAYDSYPLFPSSLYLAFGVDADLSHLPHALVMRPEKALRLPDGSTHESFSVNVYHFDSTLAPEGKTLLTVLINTWETDYWLRLAEKDQKAYKRMKDAVLDAVEHELTKRFPAMHDRIEIRDLSTPHSVVRYTHNWRGSYEGFAPTPKTMLNRLPKSLPSLQGFHMVGQWTEPGGGIPSAALDGRNLARKLCRRDGKIFTGR